MFVGVAMVASRVVRPLAYVLGAPGARFGGTAGRLARQNAVRNPARTASTAAAVMIGLALITFVAVIGQGFRTSFTSAVDELFVADYSLSAGNNGELAHEQGRQGGREGARRRGRVGDPLRRGQGRRQDRSRHRCRRQRDEGDRHEVGERLRRSVPAQLGRDGAFVDKRYAEDNSLKRRLAPDGEDADGRGPPAARQGDLRRAQGRLAVRRRSRSRRRRSTARSPTTTTTSRSSTSTGARRQRTPRGSSRASTAFPDAEVETRDEFKATRIGDIDEDAEDPLRRCSACR